ncbi:hypothetical protein PSHT_14384 [Puccinia striiformis]|uniref:Transcription initiation factor TFIID subunit 2 Ig-like domain-containing protein n=1 Tax=Puccinia striiformis TaxID=27350 RepID=A0A2S4UKN2_9BASI|nr:hypothetical protein PSHT_14384 [Puccinia striiformis]
MSSHGPQNRASSVSHQRVILDIQLDGTINRITEITILPLSIELNTVHLHSSNCTITSTYHPQPVEQLDFILNQPEPVIIPNPNSVRQSPEAKQRLCERINKKETGKLAISINRSKINQPSSSSTSTSTVQKEKDSLEFNPIIITIEYQGQMSIQIQESDGVPYERVLDITEAFRRYELPSNHKNNKFNRPNLTITQSNIKWYCLGVDLEWICGFEFNMTEFMWLEQLSRDRDIVAQSEAVRALKPLPTIVISSHLCTVFLIPEYLFRIRFEAVLALFDQIMILSYTKFERFCLKLTIYAISRCGFLGLFLLLQLFQSSNCYQPQIKPNIPWNIGMVPKPNQFNNFPDYFIRKYLNSHYIATTIALMLDSLIHSADNGSREQLAELLARGYTTELNLDSQSTADTRVLMLLLIAI